VRYKIDIKSDLSKVQVNSLIRFNEQNIRSFLIVRHIGYIQMGKSPIKKLLFGII